MSASSDIVHVVLHVGEWAALYVWARDLLRLDARVEAVEAGNVREDADERKLHGENDQLRAELDKMHRDIKALKRAHRDRDPITDWSDDRPSHQTLEGAFTPPPQPGDTQVFSPNTPKLPSFELPRPYCRHPIVVGGQCMECGGEV